MPKGVLGPEHRSLALRMYAENTSAPDIVKYFQKENIPCPTYMAIYTMCNNKCHQVELEAYKEEYYARIKDVPIAHKRTRLEARQDIIDTLRKATKKLVDAEGNIKKAGFKQFMSVVKRVEEILTGAQNEMEKKPGTVVQLMQHFGNKNITDEELIVEERNVRNKIAKLLAAGVTLGNGRIPGASPGQGPKDQA